MNLTPRHTIEDHRWLGFPVIRTVFASPTAQVVLICLAFALVVTVSILQKQPTFDEGGNINISYNLLNYGHLGMPIWLTQRESWLGTEYYTYYVLPVSVLLDTGWFALVGFGLFQMRVLSAIFGLLLIVSIYLGVKRVSGHHGIALLAMLFVATDYNITVTASDGRMDIMCAGFGFASLAAYLILRKNRLGWAFLISQLFVVASGLTHPNGILYFFGVIALIVYFDRKRVRPLHIALGALPFVAGAAGWGSYILQDVEVFRSQFFGAFTGRTFQFSEMSSLGLGRYFSAAFGIGPEVETLGRLKIFQLIAYWGAVLVYIVYRPLRTESGIGPMAMLLLVTVISMILFAPGSQLLYLVHIVPFYAVILAAVLWYIMRRASAFRLPVLAIMIFLIAIQTGGPIVKYFVKNDYRTVYVPTVERIKELRKPGDVIVASSEFGFAFGFEGEVVDDYRLGTRYGYVGDIVVIGGSYNKVYEELRVNDPGGYKAIIDRLNSMYEKVDTVSEYDIYVLINQRISSASPLSWFASM